MSIAKRGRLYRLRRRVPRRYRNIEPRETVWISLHTDSETVARSKADRAWSQMIEAWEARLAGNSSDAEARYEASRDLARASEIVTLELGRQTELEVTDQLRGEVEADRFTRLDRMLIAEQEAASEFADLRPDHDTLETMKRNRALLIARARRLEKMGLATEVRPGEWHISDRAEGTLRALGEREDIIKSMHRALDGNDLNDARGIAQLTVHRDKLREWITARVLARVLAGDGNGDRVQLVIDGTDGRVHQIELRAERCDGINCGMIVAAVPPPTEPRVADRNILAVTGSDVTYHPSRHIEIAQAEKIKPDPERYVAAHVRRLEALRRAGIVERWSEDHWKVPQDLPARGQALDRKGHGPGARLELLAPIGLDRQVTHDGATWPSKELIRQGSPDLREAGFGLEMKHAMERRKQVLVQRGDVRDLGEGRVRALRDLVQRLEAREIDRVGRGMAAERGRDWTPVKPGSRFGGELVGSTQLPSGRFAMIDNGMGFSLVPWNDSLERRLGQQIAGIGMSGGGVDWAFGRKRR